MSICQGRVEVASLRTHAQVNAGTGDRLSAALYIAGDSFQNRANLFISETDEILLEFNASRTPVGVLDSLSLY